MTLTTDLAQRRHELRRSGWFETDSGWAYKGQIVDDVRTIRDLIERKEIHVDGKAVHEADLGPKGPSPAAMVWKGDIK